ncbi:hypothetical protein C427_1897 [Paraglaciecola psychrophila 170]|uniref:Uncharacterized protein n=1 Tax=Paraglaciecola psychrophila 170 TaxID=1129794 RepID=K6YV43_9ALTE|nr:hypothetical protein C427_1897 [Paraglaciecola psychrophila 170]GAC36584.1 hypothetical protein GPSY_0946 [Paraglaciecola psychrophila 170]
MEKQCYKALINVVSGYINIFANTERSIVYNVISKFGKSKYAI